MSKKRQHRNENSFRKAVGLVHERKRNATKAEKRRKDLEAEKEALHARG